MPKKKTTEQFIEEAKLKHGDKYDYSNVEYKNITTKVEVICKEHGIFLISPEKHLYRKQGCAKCGKNTLSKALMLTTEEFIKKAKEIHGNTYDYKLVDYKGNNKEVTLICSNHGEFKQQASNHLIGSGCKSCGIKRTTIKNTKSKEEFIEKCNKKHDYKYDYSKTEYTTCKDNITVICSIHGEFEVQADNHKRGDGCKKCTNERQLKNNFDNYLKQCEEIYGDMFEYDASTYINYKNKITITCKKHGEFEQYPQSHLHSNGCKKCKEENTSNEQQKLMSYDTNIKEIQGKKIQLNCDVHGDYIIDKTKYNNGKRCPKCSSKEKGLLIRKDTEHFLNKAKEVHGDRYDYTLVKYKHSRENVDIICNIHGVFKQKPTTHFKGSGCQECAKEINIYKKEDYIKLSEKAKLYIVRIYNDKEEFYKIGKTKNTTKERLGSNIGYYNYQVIFEKESKSDIIFDLEIDLHRKYKKYKYKPKKWFAGHTECYNLDLPIEEIINLC